MNSPDRENILLRAAYDFLKKVEIEHGDALGETVFYDQADCDGYCLMVDIASQLDIEHEE
jgi:hypothetical protein